MNNNTENLTHKSPDVRSEQQQESYLVPPQYEGLPSDVVEELWLDPTDIDPEKNLQKSEVRTRALEQLRARENGRVQREVQQTEQRINRLLPEQKNDFQRGIDAAPALMSGYFQGTKELPIILTNDERFVLEKMATSYKDAKKKNPDVSVALQFANPRDAEIYANCIKRIGLEHAKSAGLLRDQEESNRTRAEIGIPEQPVTGEQPVYPNNETPDFNVGNNSSSGIDNSVELQSNEQRFGEFYQKNGETDAGFFWNEFGNNEWKALKQSGKAEWGKERLYFDIPIADLEACRDLVFQVAKEQRIPVAFKYADTQKTFPVHFDGSETRFVANFVSVHDAKRFYEALAHHPEYKKLQSDRQMDYHGLNLDGVAHYASGYRESRGALERIVTTAQQNPDGSYLYTGLDGKTQRTLTSQQYETFRKQFEAMPDAQQLWEQAGQGLAA